MTERFISLKDAPIGSILHSNSAKYNGKPIDFIVVAKNHYGNDMVTLVSKNILSYKAYDAKEPKNLKNTRRKYYGNNNYFQSNLVQWLNSNKKEWYEPLHTFDQTPDSDNVLYNSYSNEPGFLTGFSEKFISFIKEVNLSVKTGSPEGSRIIDGFAKVYLLSKAELGLENESFGENRPDGKLIDYFNNTNARKFTGTKDAIGLNASSGNGNNCYWTRTSKSDSENEVAIVNESGKEHRLSAYDGDCGLVIALNLDADLKILKDEYDEYDILLETPPSMELENKDLGILKSNIDETFKIKNDSNDSLELTITIDGYLYKKTAVYDNEIYNLVIPYKYLKSNFKSGENHTIRIKLQNTSKNPDGSFSFPELYEEKSIMFRLESLDPKISGEDKTYTDKIKGSFMYSYTVFKGITDLLRLEEVLHDDNNEVYTRYPSKYYDNPESGSSYTVEINTELLEPNKKYILVITLKDTSDNIITRRIKFQTAQLNYGTERGTVTVYNHDKDEWVN